MAGIYRVGLDYGAMNDNFLRSQGIPRLEWPRVFGDLQVLEAAAVTVFAKRAEQRAREASK